MSNTSSLPDYYEDDFRYDEPDYRKNDSILINLKLYRDWKTLWAQRLFQDECDNYDWSQPKHTIAHVSEYLYHPLFPKAFAKRISGDDERHIKLHDVEHFLAEICGENLEKQDCDYLIDILEDIRHSAKYPKNIEKALRWLANRKEELPLWPRQGILLRDSSNTTEPISAGQSNDIPSQVDKLGGNPFDGLLISRFPYESLQKLLLHLELIDAENNATNEAQPGVLREVVSALHESGCFIKLWSPAAVSAAFKRMFGAKVSESHLRIKRKAPRPKAQWKEEVFDNAMREIAALVVPKSPG